MDSLETMTAFFGWCTVINGGILAFGGFKVIVMRNLISGIHAKMFGLSEESLSASYFQFLAQYKIAIIVFNIAPYVALKFMA